MKKHSKRETKKQQQALAMAAWLEELSGYPAESLVIGIDLGDRRSTFCIRRREVQEVLLEGEVANTPAGFRESFEKLARQRIVLETGTHSRWVAQLLRRIGHEVVVGDARKLKLITHNDSKSDKVDARLLSKLGCLGVDWLHPVYQRSEEVQADLALIKAREALVETRTKLVNLLRGMAKSFGCRLPACDAHRFLQRAAAGIPEALQMKVGGLLAVLAELEEQIYAYDCLVEHVSQTKYQQATSRVRQVKGVGPLTGLAYVLTIEDPERFKHSRDVGPYLGLVPRKRQSGKRDPQCGITRAGDELLRKLLVNCGHHLLGPFGVEGDLRQWGLGLIADFEQAGQSGGRKRAAAAVARKLAVLMHRLWVSGEQFEPIRKGPLAA
jgi:transposase